MHLFKLSDYKYQAPKLGKLSDYQISDTQLKLLDYRISDIKKTTDCRALVACEVAEPDNRARKQSRVAELGSRVG
jgi:hypothetical protein